MGVCVLVWEPCPDTRLSAHGIAKRRVTSVEAKKAKRVTESAGRGCDWMGQGEVRRRLKLATAAGAGRARKCVDGYEGCGVRCGRGACQSADFPGGSAPDHNHASTQCTVFASVTF